MEAIAPNLRIILKIEGDAIMRVLGAIMGVWLYYKYYFTHQSLTICDLFQAGSISTLYSQSLNYQSTQQAQELFGRMDEKTI